MRGLYSLLRERRQNKSDPYPKCKKKLRPRKRESETTALPQMYPGENVHPLLKGETASSKRRWSPIGTRCPQLSSAAGFYRDFPQTKIRMGRAAENT